MNDHALDTCLHYKGKALLVRQCNDCNVKHGIVKLWCIAQSSLADPVMIWTLQYTPLLPAAATGTVEERSIVEPVRRIVGRKACPWLHLPHACSALMQMLRNAWLSKYRTPDKQGIQIASLCNILSWRSCALAQPISLVLVMLAYSVKCNSKPQIVKCFWGNIPRR